MKPFLAIDLTNDKNNEAFNGDEFLVQKPSDLLSKSFEDSSDKAEETIEKAKLPLPIRIIECVCGFAALIIVFGILRSDVSIQEGYQNAPWLYWTGGICAVIWLVLWLLGKQKEKTVLDNEDSTQTFSHLESASQAIFNELSVPADAKDIDILLFFYKVKDGVIKVQEKGLQFAKYLNPEYKIFADSENLYLANLDGKYAFPLSSITKISTIKKHISIIEWNKEEAYNKGIYKQYKLTTDKYDCIHCKYYHILELNHQGETVGIYVPCYELHTLEEVTGLKAEGLE